ncbi:MAG TPA: hypothetical protein ENI31_00960 [Candidatus Omnitrophica bacterium]|nr:MAG: hypothetical protein DRP69_05025 [Candidatus Omnitrophota bacterium]RKY43928.1 MAG: hypothetical protein DRP80_03885 [Candidatus Omnitrophota bacterium]HEC68845.1 hypothetical protein [Candidatus Omnitrophota bacterium]
MAIGACIQNMLLCAQELGIGSCWLGEILNKKEKVRKLLNIDKNYELMAVVSIGYPLKKPNKGKRKRLKTLILDPEENVKKS